jgi:hypothetical protein
MACPRTIGMMMAGAMNIMMMMDGEKPRNEYDDGGRNKYDILRLRRTKLVFVTVWTLHGDVDSGWERTPSRSSCAQSICMCEVI